MVSVIRLGLVPLCLYDKDFTLANNNIAVTKNTTIAELIESVSEGAAIDSASDTDCVDSGCAPRPATLVTSIAATAAITAVNKVAHVPRKFENLPELQLAIGW